MGNPQSTVNMPVVIADAEPAHRGMGAFAVERSMGKCADRFSANGEHHRLKGAASILFGCNGTHVPHIITVFNKYQAGRFSSLYGYGYGYGYGESDNGGSNTNARRTPAAVGRLARLGRRAKKSTGR